LLTIIVCSVDIGGLADHHCLFCWYWWTCWPSLFALLILVDLLTIIICSDGQQVHQYQQNKQWWSASPLISTEQTMMVSKSTNINRTNNDGQQVHQYQQNKQWWLASPPILTEQTMMVSKSTNINRTNNDTC
jgi:spore coat protein CotF